MQVVEFLESADGVHVGVEAISRGNVVRTQLGTFPLCQRVHHLGRAVVHRLDGERHGTLHSIEVVVKASAGEHKQRCCHAAQIQRPRKLLLKSVFDILDGHLGGFWQQLSGVLFWDYKSHINSFM